MKIRLTIPDGEPEDIEVKDGTTIEDLYNEHKEGLEYKVMVARVNNKYTSLTEPVEDGQEIELLDMRNKGACRVYQASISMIFLKAAREVLGNVLCEISNSLNKGLFVELKMKDGSTEEMVEEISGHMRAIVNRDVPFRKEVLSREAGLERVRQIGDRAKLRLVEDRPELDELQFYSIDDYSQFFYTIMVPSTGYCDKFLLEKYKRGILLRFPDKYDPNSIPDYVDEVNMYKAFSEQSEWGRLMGVNYVADLNEKIEKNECKDMIQLSEALHDKKVTEIANMIDERKARLVLIAGPSSSGKTTFARRLCIHLRVNGMKALYMGTDDYFVDRKDMIPDDKGEFDFEGLDAVDTELFNHDMKALLAGEEVDLPEFNFIEGRKEFGKRITKIDRKTVIVIEGIHALNDVLTPDIDRADKFKIYISPLTQLNIDAHNRIPTTDERLLRRITRDDRTRGRDAAETIRNWPSVRRGEDRNIFKYCNEADVMFNSYHIYEIAVLKKYVDPLLKAITKDQPEYAEAKRIRKILDFFKIIEDDSFIGNDSILREFIGGSIYVS